jgi:hypothetical protein
MKKQISIPLPKTPKGNFLAEKRPNQAVLKTLVALGVVASAYGASAASESIQSHHVAQQEAQFAAEKSRGFAEFQTKKADVHAIANRYDLCDIAGEAATVHKVVTAPQSRIPRDRVTFTIEGQRNEAGKRADAKYPPGHIDEVVSRGSRVRGFLVKKDEQGQPKVVTEIDNAGPLIPSRVEGDKSVVSLYPKANTYSVGTEIAVFADTQASANDAWGNLYQEAKSKYCGTITLEADQSWQPTEHSTVIDEQNAQVVSTLEQLVSPHK